MSSITPVILDEDTYTDAIGFIIERDFFPNLAKMKAHTTYLEAQAHGSLIDLQQAGKALHDLETGSGRQQGKSTNINSLQQAQNFYNAEALDLSERVNLNLSLDQFQTLYTSEDNASFADLLEKANAKRKEKYQRIFHKESKQLRITDAPHEQSSVKLVEPGDIAPGTWKYKVRNALMYLPEGKSESWINEESARGAPKAIAYTNTQFEIADTTAEGKNLAPSDRIIRQGGTATPWHQITSTGNGEAGSTPGFRGYSLVEATPTITPGQMGTPMMTWGSIEGTPMLISGSETPGPQFSMPKTSRREEIGMALSNKASKAYRKKINDKERAVRGTPRTGAGLMSPAAQHLLRRSKTPYGFDAALRSSYVGSPTPSIHGGAKTPRTPLFRAGATPSATRTPAKK
ncbi:nuclear protein DGCR14 [Radiomyces spectabilis]|uniref:nuclear protein DGCR14 n=1 Tax=Radiomyces spectabilis TaxID=64574 RepID=UPI00221FE1E6|nr:nuclear protein DGCR14 [Radiomyces spectabilis]KAI8394290.1 nuclear protein DGCR14 [Radiomyces spectabilis]